MSSAIRQVTLREITAATVRRITNLSVKPEQRRLVATNAESLAEALFTPEAWYRAIYLGDEPVGFVMLFDESQCKTVKEQPELWVWRLMVDANHQRGGIGRSALRLVIDHARGKRAFSRLLLSHVAAEGSAETFYRSLGFIPTGQVEGGEVVMARNLEVD